MGNEEGDECDPMQREDPSFQFFGHLGHKKAKEEEKSSFVFVLGVSWGPVIFLAEIIFEAPTFSSAFPMDSTFVRVGRLDFFL